MKTRTIKSIYIALLLVALLTQCKLTSDYKEITEDQSDLISKYRTELETCQYELRMCKFLYKQGE